MFGSLFEEEKPAGVMTSVHTLGVKSLPLPRHPCGFSGIENQGATCYLNSLLQTLLYTPEFREGLFALSEEELGNLEDRDKGSKVRIIPLQLQRLFTCLLLVNQQAASTTDLTDSFGWNNNEELQQHDVQELNRILFSAIESSLVGTSGKNLISELYHGTTVSEIVCQNCGKISEKVEDFLDLNVIVACYSSLQESLNATFLQKEIMKGKNQYRCSTCCNLVDAKKGLKIRCLPPILTFSLLRFSYDLSKGERYKETGKFIFPLEVDMASYCDKQLSPDDTTYELFSVVIHSGSSYGGHYHAYIRDVDCLGKWMPPDEEPILVTQQMEKETSDVIQGPVSLIKALLSQQQDQCLSIDALCLEISKCAGLSWNKRFKKTYGPINKFLQKHDDVFFFNSSTNMVYLKDGVAKSDSTADTSPANPSSTPAASIDSAPSSPKESKKSTVMNTLKLNLFDRKRGLIANAAFDHNWFDFNDSKVNPIFVKDIEKQFSGKESAYMLFYRRKSLLRPLEAKGNRQYMIPERLLQFAEDENIELEKQREQYEIALNTVTLQVHLGENYCFHNGALDAKPDVLSVLELTIDKRKHLGSLRDSIIELLSEICPNVEFTLHVAREVPAGLHLYEELTSAQNDTSLKDLGIFDGTKIFVWDGIQVGGEIILVGAAHEPILLNISATLLNSEATEFSRGFPKTMTVGELRVMLSNLVPLPLEDLIIGRIDLQGEESSLLPLEENQNGCTLEELGLLDGDSLVVQSATKNTEFTETAENSKPVVLFVQNCCYVNNDAETPESPLVELSVNPDCTLSELKSLATSKLGLDDAKDYRLRKFIRSHGKKPPIHEDLTVKEANLSEVDYIIIEEGLAPSEKQITVMFSIGALAGDNPDFEVTVNRTNTIQQCLKLMLGVAGLEGDAWHLRKTNWYGEPMEQLASESATLEDEGIQHGECLLIVEGRLPPKGFLNFTVWLHPTFESLQNPQPPVNGLLPGLDGLCKSLSCSTLNEQICGLVKLGEVELSNESTLGELKKYVLTLPLLSSVCLPSIRHLRLRILEGTRPARVLRGLSNPLRKLKIPSHQQLCVQILSREEDMMQNDVLLNVSQRIPDSKTYAPPMEMVWDASKSASPKSLKQSLSDYLAVPVHRLVIAKHFSERFEWLVIDDGSGQKKQSKKRWGMKLNLRHSPFFLKDGDTIGVKDRLCDPEGTDDFCTEEDLIGQAALKAEAEKREKRLERRRARERRRDLSGSGEWMLGGSDQGTPRHAKKSEVGITIHVDNFS